MLGCSGNRVSAPRSVVVMGIHVASGFVGPAALRVGPSSAWSSPPPRPLADSEKLPVQKHRNAEAVKSPEKESVPTVEKKSKKPKKKEKKPKEREREKKKDKKVHALGLWLECKARAAEYGVPASPARGQSKKQL